jgi:hypothetical protein
MFQEKKVNILADHSIGHSEKKSSHEHVPDSECLPICCHLNLQIQNIVNGNKEREISYC